MSPLPCHIVPATKLNPKNENDSQSIMLYLASVCSSSRLAQGETTGRRWRGQKANASLSGIATRYALERALGSTLTPVALWRRQNEGFRAAGSTRSC